VGAAVVACPFYFSGINYLSLLDKVKLAAMALLIALTLLLCAVQVEGLRLPVSQASQGQLVDARPASAQNADLHAIPGPAAWSTSW